MVPKLQILIVRLGKQGLLTAQGVDPHPPLPLREGRPGRNHLNEEITVPPSSPQG
jgi:hypothetical protein